MAFAFDHPVRQVLLKANDSNVRLNGTGIVGGPITLRGLSIFCAESKVLGRCCLFEKRERGMSGAQLFDAEIIRRAKTLCQVKNRLFLNSWRFDRYC